MALKKAKVITLPNLLEVTGEYWRIYKLGGLISSDGSQSTEIGLELWLDKATRDGGESEPLTTLLVSAPLLFESREAAYEWLEQNVGALSGAEDI